MLKRAAAKMFPRWRDYRRIRWMYKHAFGELPNLRNPQSINEKIQRYKLVARDSRMPKRADKVLVKEFVRDRLGDEWIVPTLWHGPGLPLRQERNWPIPFVVKCNHGSAMNVFVRCADELNWSRIESLCDAWLTQTHYGDWGGEWVYSKIKPQVLVEPFINELSELPTDYKLWTFSGRVGFIQVDTDREVAHKRTMFDRDWNRLPFTTGYPVDDREIARPASLARMIDAAEVLSESMPFVRADFYDIAGRPIFGELTYYPDSGTARFEPPEYDRQVSAMWM
jgi:hypothetical protein